MVTLTFGVAPFALFQMNLLFFAFHVASAAGIDTTTGAPRGPTWSRTPSGRGSTGAGGAVPNANVPFHDTLSFFPFDESATSPDEVVSVIVDGGVTETGFVNVDGPCTASARTRYATGHPGATPSSTSVTASCGAVSSDTKVEPPTARCTSNSISSLLRSRHARSTSVPETTSASSRSGATGGC